MNASFKDIFTLKLFIAFKMAYSCCFSLGGNLDFPDLLQKSFTTSTAVSKNRSGKCGNQNLKSHAVVTRLSIPMNASCVLLVCPSRYEAFQRTRLGSSSSHFN